MTTATEKTQKDYAMIPGTKWGIRRYSHGIEICERVMKQESVKGKKTGREHEGWGTPKYPVNFAQAAAIIAEAVGDGELTDILVQIVEERAKLAEVLKQILETSGIKNYWD